MSSESPLLPTTTQLFEEMPCGLLATAVDGTILRVNATFCRWVGASPEDLIGKKKLQELLTMGARIFHQTHWLPMLEMQGSISEVKFDVRVKDGKPLPMILNVLRRIGETGVYDQVAAFIAEDRNKYERELLAARKRADKLVAFEKDRALFAEQMIGIVSHDLRNPLAVVMLSTRMLATRSHKLTDEQSQRMLASVTRAGERAQRLIEDLLDFTLERMGQGLKVSLAPVDLGQLIDTAVDELALAYPERLLCHARSGAGVVNADADRLTQLLGNLVGNAVAYGAPATRITISSYVSSGLTHLEVHNEGNAIAPHLLTTMFEPMVRGPTLASTGRSVGLGLYIVRAIALAHHGNVSVTSSNEGGTRFTVTFPSQLATSTQT